MVERIAYVASTASRGVSHASRTPTAKARAVIGSARPVRRSRALPGLSLATISTAEAVGRPSLRFRAPSETCLPSPARRRRLPVGRSRPAPCRAMLPLLGFRSLRHMPARWIRIRGWRLPAATACHVRGLATPLAASTNWPPSAEALERPWVSPFMAFPSLAVGSPLGVPALLTLPGALPPKGACVGPPSGPRSRGESVLSSRSRSSSTVDAILGFAPPEPSPHPPGVSLVVASPALSPFGGVTSRSAWTTGLRGSDGSAWPVSGLPALLGFRTFRPSRHSVRRAGRRAHGFASRGTSLDRRDRPRSKPPQLRRSRNS